jgi:Mg2+-importing ATPase
VKITQNPSLHSENHPGVKEAHFSDQLLENARANSDTVLKELKSQIAGLSSTEASSRLILYGLNEIAQKKPPSAIIRLLTNFKNPLVILLLVLGFVSFLTGDLRAMIVIFVMVLLGVVLRFFQELRADNCCTR